MNLYIQQMLKNTFRSIAHYVHFSGIDCSLSVVLL